MKLFIFFLILLNNIFDTIREVYIKAAVNSLNFSPHGFRENVIFIVRLLKIPRLWWGLLFSILSLVTWLFALSKVELNYAFSIDSMHYIFIAFVSQKFLKEKVSPTRWLGVILITAGIAVVAFS